MSRNLPEFEKVVGRLKAALDVKTDTELAEMLEMERNAFYYRRFSKSIPYKNIVELCYKLEISVDGIMGI